MASSDVDLQVAVMVGDGRGVKKYIDDGGDLEVRDEDGATALFHAAFWTHVEIAKDLIYAGADLFAQRNDGFTALHVAVKNNQPRMTEVLVKAMKKNLRIQEEFGDTALHCAYRSKATECIETLLAAGADPEILNHMGKTPRECEGTGVDRQEDMEDFDDDDDPPRSAEVSDAPSAGDASTVVGGCADQDQDGGPPSRSPSRPSDGRSAAANSSPRTNRHRSGAHNGDGRGRGQTEDNLDSEYGKALFRIAYPPSIRGGGQQQWHSMTAYLFEPSANRAVRNAHQACIDGDQHHPFVTSESTNTVEDCDRAIPSGTQVTVRPRFPRSFCVSPVNATVAWTKDVHAVPFEVHLPVSAASRTISGCVEFYIGAVLIGQAHVEITVEKPNDSRNTAEKPNVLGPVAKAFDTVYMCFAAADGPLLLPSFERFNRLGIAKLSWRPERGSDDKETTKRLIRESSVFQLCWSNSAKESSRVKNELTYAGSLAKAGSVAVRGIYWDPSMDVTSISTAQGLAFPVQLHNSFLLEEPCVNRLLDRTADMASTSQDTAGGAQGRNLDGGNINDDVTEDTSAVHEVENLCKPTVEQTRGHMSRLREMVDGADVVDVPRVVWIHPDDSGGKAGSVDITTDGWLKKPIRVNFLCPISLKPGRCGEDGKGYTMSLPRGWASKIGLALKIGVVVTATASDAGEVAGLPIPSSAAITAWAEDNGRGLSSAEKQGDMVNAAFDGLATAVADKSNELIDSAFMDAELEGSSPPTPSAQLRKDVKNSYTNLRSLLQKYDKGLKMTGLEKVTHKEEGGSNKTTTEWVHPSVAELFRRAGPAIFDRGGLAKAAREAAAREKAAAMQQKKASGGRGENQWPGKGQGHDVMSTLRILEKQVLSLVEGGSGSSGGGA